MTEPTDPTPRQALLDALDVHRYARIALVVGAVVAVGVAVAFVGVLAGGETGRPAALYLALAFVVFATTAALALAVLVGRRALRLAVHPASVVRPGATVGAVAGTLWLVGGLALLAGDSRLDALAGAALPWAGPLTPVGLWAVHTRYKRSVPARPVAAAGALVAAVGALVVADLAAFDLYGLVPAVGRGVDPGVARPFVGGAVLLAGGHLAVAALVATAEPARGTPVALGLLPAVGLGVLLLAGPGRVGLAGLSACLGCGWIVVGWRLRGVSDEAVPGGRPLDTPTRRA